MFNAALFAKILANETMTLRASRMPTGSTNTGIQSSRNLSAFKSKRKKSPSTNAPIEATSSGKRIAKNGERRCSGARAISLSRPRLPAIHQRLRRRKYEPWDETTPGWSSISGRDFISLGTDPETDFMGTMEQRARSVWRSSANLRSDRKNYVARTPSALLQCVAFFRSGWQQHRRRGGRGNCCCRLNTSVLRAS